MEKMDQWLGYYTGCFTKNATLSILGINNKPWMLGYHVWDNVEEHGLSFHLLQFEPNSVTDE